MLRLLNIRPVWAIGITFLFSLSVLVGAVLAWGPTRELEGDSLQYCSIAQSLAAGGGYKNTVGPWPDRVSYDRMPGWPAVMMAALWAAPHAAPEAVARYTGAVCLAVAGAFFTLLSIRLGVWPALAAVAGLGVALSPPLVFLSLMGMSEICFVLLAVMGLAGISSGGWWFYAGALALGAASLVRTNFILLPAGVVTLGLLIPGARRALLEREQLRRLAVAAALAYVLPLGWMVRNYAITGRFPLLSSFEGEAFYGSNNEVVANELDYWGVWVMPDRIPGETPKLSLARSGITDLQLNDYYHGKAVAWIKANGKALPRLILGKLIRGFVPIPWVPRISSYFAFSYRLLLDVMVVALAGKWWGAMNRTYLLICLAMFAVNLATTVMFYGVYRFTHCFVEIWFLPLIVCGVQQWVAGREAVQPRRL